MPVWLGIALGTLMGGIFGLLIGILVLPLRAAYLALFTLGFSEILRAAISAEIAITRGQAGIELPYLFDSGITLFGHHFDKTDKLPPYFVMFFLLLACLGIMTWLAKSKFGLFVRALREDQDAAAALGVNTTRYKVLVFVITSMMAAAAGAVMAHYVRIITPNNLMILQMSLVVAMAVIGGVENFVAAAIGAIIIEIRAGVAAQLIRDRPHHGRHDDLAFRGLRHAADADPALFPQRPDRAAHRIFRARPRRRRDGGQAPGGRKRGHPGRRRAS